MGTSSKINGDVSYEVKDVTSTDWNNLKDICVKYFQLMICIANNELPTKELIGELSKAEKNKYSKDDPKSFKKMFLKKPRYYLDKIKMVIPKHAELIFNTNELRWATVTIRRKNNKGCITEIEEGYLSFKAMWEEKKGISDGLLETVDIESFKEPKFIDFKIIPGLKECDITIELPFFDVADDCLDQYSFNGKKEMVLTCCC